MKKTKKQIESRIATLEKSLIKESELFSKVREQNRGVLRRSMIRHETERLTLLWVIK